MVSIVVPSNEETSDTNYRRTLSAVDGMPDVEIILVGKHEAPTRAERLNIGFSRSKGSMILFHHPRSFLEREAIAHLTEIQNEKVWGAFTHQFDVSHPILKFTSFYSNSIRGEKEQIYYLDHCIFFHRQLWLGDIPPVAIFEDTVLSRRLSKSSRPIRLPYISTTSAVRFQKNGVIRQSLMNQVLKLGYAIGVPDKVMNEFYEKGLRLNEALSSYSTKNK